MTALDEDEVRRPALPFFIAVVDWRVLVEVDEVVISVSLLLLLLLSEDAEEEEADEEEEAKMDTPVAEAPVPLLPPLLLFPVLEVALVRDPWFPLLPAAVAAFSLLVVAAVAAALLLLSASSISPPPPKKLSSTKDELVVDVVVFFFSFFFFPLRPLALLLPEDAAALFFGSLERSCFRLLLPLDLAPTGSVVSFSAALLGLLLLLLSAREEEAAEEEDPFLSRFFDVSFRLGLFLDRLLKSTASLSSLAWLLLLLSADVVEPVATVWPH